MTGVTARWVCSAGKSRVASAPSKRRRITIDNRADIQGIHPMYTLYWSPGSASVAPHACLEEAGAAYTLKRVDTSKGEHQQPEYLALNPKGKVPTLVVDKDVLTESAAICMLIGDRHPDAGLAPVVGDHRRGHYYGWLTHLTNTLQPAMLEFYYPDRHTTSANGTEAVAAKARE